MIFKASSKAEAGRKLALITQEIQNRVKKFNSVRSIPMLLCSEDAINNLEIEIHKARNIKKEFDEFPNKYFAVITCIIQWYNLIDKMILYISEMGFKDFTTKIKTEAINFGVSLQDDYISDIMEFENELIEKESISLNFSCQSDIDDK